MALRKRLFCNAKPTLLPCKTAAFTMSKRSYHFLRKYPLQNKSYFDKLQSSKSECSKTIC
ncbi:hypothetical protein CBG57_07785 [Prevotella nigrescens]|nr:hypothetical protein CBG57_07785 [Prevotella nigrescens]